MHSLCSCFWVPQGFSLGSHRKATKPGFSPWGMLSSTRLNIRLSNRTMQQDERSALKVISEEQVRGDDEGDTALLLAMAEQAEQYIQSFTWCTALKKGIYADGIGGVIALFLFRVDIKKLGDDQWTWVFVGDIPSAYLEMEDYKSPYDALERYIEGLEEWIAATRSGLPLNDLIPIKVPNDPALIESLALRTATLRENILPHISRDPISP
jgi:hypothetical protein